jgi:hypothetical protein
MRKACTLAGILGVVLLVAAVAGADGSRFYPKSVELVWDEAIKAVRDADLVLTDSNRSEHWFEMKTPEKTVKRTVRFEVRLVSSGTGTQVTVRGTDRAGTNRSDKMIDRYLNALDERMR